MVAAGSGSRLGASVPKALVRLGERTLVEHAVAAMIAGGAARVVVTVPADHVRPFEEALAGFPEARWVVGGAERQDSVRLGLRALTDEFGPETVVLVHDAARPLVPQQVVAAVVDGVRDGAAVVIPVVSLHDSVRTSPEHGSVVVDRATLRAVQTPQGATLGTLVAAHRHVHEQGIQVTDDASAVETLGHGVAQVPGHRDAAKITEPVDLLLAEVVLAARSSS